MPSHYLNQWWPFHCHITWPQRLKCNYQQTHVTDKIQKHLWTWWRHQMETFSALLAICAGNSPVPGELPAQRPVTRSFDVSFHLRQNKRLNKQLWGWGFETLLRPLWRQCNELLSGQCHRTPFVSWQQVITWTNVDTWWHQAITWANVNQDLCQHMASLNHNESNNMGQSRLLPLLRMNIINLHESTTRRYQI